MHDVYLCFESKSEQPLEDLVNVKYRRARIYYEANHFKSAALLFKDIAMNHSEDGLALYAANLFPDCEHSEMVFTPSP